MDSETLKTYSILGLSLAVVASLFYGIQPDPTHYCDNEQTQRYCFDVSGGSHTRCYLTPEKNSWDTCSTGWVAIPEWAEEENEDVVVEVVKIFGNGCLHECPLDGGELRTYTICECEDGKFAYAGELI